ncbi:MAG TPA: hypothetical protein VLA87_05930 [Gaiellaceae bacterium]|nr:hypothetical protein [Gaiellaceae bacterium]
MIPGAAARMSRQERPGSVLDDPTVEDEVSTARSDRPGQRLVLGLLRHDPDGRLGELDAEIPARVGERQRNAAAARLGVVQDERAACAELGHPLRGEHALEVVAERDAQVVAKTGRVVLVGLARTERFGEPRIRVARRDLEQRARRVGDRDRVRRGVRVERADVGEHVGLRRRVAGVRLLARGIPRAPLLASTVQVLVDDGNAAHSMSGVLQPHRDRVDDRVALAH